ncbi:MAG: patatin-like phospholipase family protein [Rhizobiaceae bacterium]|nr:patatin-like phospholipase family protein [Rhizobiaceae bacterium]
MRRALLPSELVAQEDVAGIESKKIRIWGDATRAELAANLAANTNQIGRLESSNRSDQESYLVLSGGGQNGAFGAGLLNGWTKAGTRPDFRIVTGVSTGALIAPFAYLGPSYDAIIKEFYTTHSTKDIVKYRVASGVLGGVSVGDSKPLAGLIAKYITRDTLREIAAEHQKGRYLLVGTTNLDAGRPVIWNMGEIAQVGDDRALKLFRSVILASASIPGAFPPVMIDVSADGKLGQEMHVDGGTTDNAILVPFHINLKDLYKRFKWKPKRKVYVIINSTLSPRRKRVKAGTFSIAARSINTLIKRLTISDTQRLYDFAQRNEIQFYLAGIPIQYNEKSKELFDKAYMKKLFSYGYNLAKSGYKWGRKPPDT